MLFENGDLRLLTVLNPPTAVTLYAVSAGILSVFGMLDTLDVLALLAGAGVTPCAAAVGSTELRGALAIGKALEDRVVIVLEESSFGGSAAAASAGKLFAGAP